MNVNKAMPQRPIGRSPLSNTAAEAASKGLLSPEDLAALSSDSSSCDLGLIPNTGAKPESLSVSAMSSQAGFASLGAAMTVGGLAMVVLGKGPLKPLGAVLALTGLFTGSSSSSNYSSCGSSRRYSGCGSYGSCGSTRRYSGCGSSSSCGSTRRYSGCGSYSSCGSSRRYSGCGSYSSCGASPRYSGCGSRRSSCGSRRRYSGCGW